MEARTKYAKSGDVHIATRYGALESSKVLDILLDEIDEFVTGRRNRPNPDQILATAVPADMIGSARHVPQAWAGAEMGSPRGRHRGTGKMP
jgi:hypothetical protein